MCYINQKEDGSFVQICNCKYGSSHSENVKNGEEVKN